MVQETGHFQSAAPPLGAALRRLRAADLLPGQPKASNAPACLRSGGPPGNIRPNFSCRSSTTPALRRKPSAQLEAGLQERFPRVSERRSPRSPLLEHDTLMLAGALALLQHDSRI